MNKITTYCKHLTIIFAFTTSLSCIASTQDTSSSNDYYKLAKIAYAQLFTEEQKNTGGSKGLVDTLNQMLDSTNDTVNKIDTDTKDLPNKIAEYCTKALDINDDSIEGIHSSVYNTRGHAFYKLKEYKKAIADHTISIDLLHSDEKPSLSGTKEERLLAEGELSQAYSWLIITYYDWGKYHQAISTCDEIITDNTEPTLLMSAYLMRAQAHFRLGNISQATEDMKTGNNLMTNAAKQQESINSELFEMSQKNKATQTNHDEL